MRSKLRWTLALFMTLLVQLSFAQEKTLKGVVSEDGLPLPGVSVVIKGTTLGTQTDLDGNYSIKAKQGEVVVFSFIGLKPVEYKVATADTFNVSMKAEDSILDEVVVVAYGTATKESVTGAMAVVNNADIQKRPATNAIGALEGAASGVQVNNTSGQPGAEPQVRIRGFTSLRPVTNGVDPNAPLYVVDGVPYGGSITDINPADIESMSVLKDASSSTLYGNRASNGVILITTKKGGKGSGSFNLDVKQGVFTRGTKDYDRLGADDFMNTMWTGYRNNQVSTGNKTLEQANALANANMVNEILKLNIYNLPANELFENGKLKGNAHILDGYRGDLDWYKPIERTGLFQDINMSGRVANDKGGAFFSAGLLNNESYIKNSDLKRITARVNADYQVNEWLKVGANLSGSHQDAHGITASRDDSNSYVNPFMFARNMAPIYPVHLHDSATGAYIYDEDGNLIYDRGDKTRAQYQGRHVVWENDLNTTQTIRNTMSGQVFADIKFLKDFTFSLRGDLNTRNTEERRYENAIIGDGSGTNGRGRRNNYSYKTYTGQQLLSWNKSFGLHNVEALAGHENYSTEYTYLYAIKTNQTFPGKVDFINFNDITSLYDYKNIYRTEGYLSRAKYNYANKYFAEASFRRDGSSKFSKDNRWGNFWSVGGSWIVSNEDFFNVDEINYLKLRASYGEVGNDMGASFYAYQSLYSIEKNGGASALYKSQNGNDDLKWETSSSINFGVDTRLFNRVNLSVEYFDKRSQNLLVDLNLPLSNGSTDPTVGASKILSNVGSISNRGLEVTVDVDVIKKGGWTWNVGANATWLKNKVVSLAEENRKDGILTSSYHKVTEGGSIYDFYLYQYVGVDQMTGNSLFEIDTDKYSIDGANGKAKVDSNYLVKIGDEYYTTYNTYARKALSGSAIPKMNGSFSTALSYKNFSLSALFTYSIGGKVYDTSYESLMSVNSNPGAIHKDILGAWDGIPEGMTEGSVNRIDANGTPVIDYGRNTYTSASLSTRWLQDASYLVVKNISLAYDMPKETMSKIGLRGMRFTATVENLATFTKMDGMNPQQTYNGVLYNTWLTPRTFTFGVNVSF